MQIWVDADACPNAIKEILFRAANRKKISTTLIANHAIATPPSPFIRSQQVPAGADIADNEILRRCEEKDLIITSDIPFAAEALQKHTFVLTPRGSWLTSENIGQRLNMRDFMETMRASGIQSGGPPALNEKDKKAFADQLDKHLTKHHQST